LANDILVGGYGIDLGHVFCGESFLKVSNASKVAFIALVNHKKKKITSYWIAKFIIHI
jgi:leucyl/phenylalanyl-tRNA--protein transferase